MRYADGGGLTDAERLAREAVLMAAVADFAAGATYQEVAARDRAEAAPCRRAGSGRQGR